MPTSASQHPQSGSWSRLVLALLLALGTSGSTGIGQGDTSLVGAYSFGDASGATVMDLSGKANHGTPLNGVTSTATGKYGSALWFDGVNDVVAIADAASLDLTTGMTLEAWVKPAGGSEWAAVIAKGSAAPEGSWRKARQTDPLYALYTSAEVNRVSVILRINSRSWVLEAPLGTGSTTWVHVAATYDGRTARLYVNGRMSAARSVTGWLGTSSQRLLIGNDASRDYFRGAIDEVRIYNRALSESQIQADMYAPLGVSPADTQAPAVTLVAPATGSTVSGTVSLSADASDNTGVASVQFLRDGVGIGAPDTGAPYSVSWDTTGVADGDYAISARAVDAAGNSATSPAISVRVSNAPPPPEEVTLGTLNGHAVYGDASRAIVSWLTPQHSSYDQAVAIAWDFLLNRVPNDRNGLKAYFTNSYLQKDTLWPSGWMHNPAHLYAAVIESALAYYAYSGDARVIGLARSMADYHLANGLTPAEWVWPRVPYASGCGHCATYDGTGTHDTAGYIQPDKVGELGLSLIRLYEFTGDIRYRDAAIDAATALATNIRPGDATNSPWPFRVNAQTNVPSEQYSANVIKPIALFDALIRIGLGDVTRFAAARRIALDWLLAYPMQNNVWSNYFEDVAIQPDLRNVNQYIPMETAYYLMLHPEHDPEWRTHVPALIAWVEATFGEPQFGANAIREQIVFHFAMGSHTSRYAAVNALYFELTGDAAAREKAYRALNWATYMISSTPQGQIIDGPQVGNIWFTDGYGDYIRHFMRAMGAVPEWAPAQQNHLTRSTSIVTAVSYGAGDIAYTTADPDGVEVLKVSFTPREVTANGVPLTERADLGEAGWTFDGTTGVLRVRHAGAASIRVAGEFSGIDTIAPSIRITAPAPAANVSGAAVAIAADASDNVGVMSVQFLLDGAPLSAPDRTAPYSLVWDSTAATNGVHTLAAVATDTAGLTSTATAVQVTVDNTSQRIITFNDAPHSQALSGVYPAGVADWGSAVWFLSPPWGRLTTNSISFNSSTAKQASFTFVTPQRLLSGLAFNGGSVSSTVTFSCGANPAVQVVLAPNELRTISTSWTQTCSTVTIASSNGWDTNFDDLTYDQAQ